MANVLITINGDDQSSQAFQAAKNNFKSLSTAAMALGPALAPVAAAATAAVAGLASTLGGAAVAAGAFKLAVQPQMAAVQDAAAAQEKYNQAVEQYGKNSDQAKAAQAALKTQMEGMTPATQETAKAFVGLKGDFTKWSDSLSGSTMPVFTKGIGVLRTILPMLTPIVQGAAVEFGKLMDKIKTKVESPSFEEFMKKVATWSTSGLKKTIEGITGIASAIKNFVMSEGFRQFLDMGGEAGSNIGDILKKLAQFAMEFVKAAGPMAGLSFAALGLLADALNAIPQELLEVLAPTIFTIIAAIKAWRLAVIAYTAVQWLMNAAVIANPIGLLIAALAAVAVALFFAWKKSETFRDVVMKVWEAVKKAFSAAWNFIRDKVFAPIGRFFTETIPRWAGTLKEKVIGAWEGIKKFVGKALDFLKNLFLNWTGPGLIIKHWDNIKKWAGKAVDWIRTKFNDMVSFFTKLPGRIGRAVSGLWDGIKSAFKSAVNWIIRKWNDFQFTIGGGSVLGVDIPKVTLKTPNVPLLARGGIASGLAMVGERGAELVDLPAGSRVRSHADTERILRGRGGGGTGPIHVHVHMGDRELGEWVMDTVRGQVRRRGGLQRAFGG